MDKYDYIWLGVKEGILLQLSGVQLGDMQQLRPVMLIGWRQGVCCRLLTTPL